MFSRVASGIKFLTPQLRKQLVVRSIGVQSIRLFNKIPSSVEAKQTNESNDLLFDLGGSSVHKHEKPKKNKSKKPKNADSSTAEPLSRTPVKKANKELIPDDKKARTFEQLKYHDISMNLTYIKLPFNHPEFSKLMLMLKSRKYREKENLLLLEGRRLTLEAIDVGLKIKYLLFSNVKQIEVVRNDLNDAFTKDATIIRVPHNDLSFWSTLSTCPGLISVFERPKDMSTIWRNVKETTSPQLTAADEDNEIEKSVEELESQQNPLTNVPVTLICDQIREPNNLGAIIRTAAALPCEKIILMKGCADPWDIKALRGGCGAQFRIPIIGPIEWETLTEHIPTTEELTVFVADTKADSTVPTAEPWDDFEHARKQNNIKFFEPKPYGEIAFGNCKNIALIVGGETEGVSSHAVDFMHFVSKESSAESEPTDDTNIESATKSSIVKIPLGNGIESLNATIATAILLFEMRKQLIGQ